jgi:tripartite-type tricarboxylate transporter receptor subunit TctC
MTKILRRTFAAGLGAILGRSGREAAARPDARRMTILVPYPPGGPTDVVAREIAAYMSETLKTSVIVENKAGGGAQIAMSALKAAPADGTTLLVSDSTGLVTNVPLYPKLNYDPRRDLQALTLLMYQPCLLVVPVNSPYSTLEQLLDAARTKSGGLNYATSGPGSGSHIFGSYLAERLRLTMTAVHYRGTSPALVDVAGGQVDFIFNTIGSSAPLVQTGKLRALAVGGADARMPQFPDVPTLGELGYAWASVPLWWGAVAKAGTSAADIDRLNGSIVAAMQDLAIARKFAEQGITIRTSSPAEMQAYIVSEIESVTRIVRETGMTVD